MVLLSWSSLYLHERAINYHYQQQHQIQTHYIMLFCLLPQELILHIFKQLLPKDTQSLIQTLSSSLPHRNASRITKLLYVRLYLGHTVISVSDEPPKEFDVCLSPEEFMDLGEDPEFLVNIPRQLDMVFVRNIRDYTKFQNSLAEFRQVLETEWALKYLAQVQKLTFKLDGRSITTENPTLMLALVLNTLITLTNLGKDNLHSISVSSTDIGELFPQKWGKMLGGFTQVKTLSLADNLMRLELLAGNEPVLEKHFSWPPQLRELSLARNYIKRFTLDLVTNFPKTLQLLDMSANIIDTIGSPYSEPFSLVEILPNLKFFSLRENRYLVTVDLQILEKAEGLVVDVRGSNIHEEAMSCLSLAAQKNNVKLVTAERGGV